MVDEPVSLDAVFKDENDSFTVRRDSAESGENNFHRSDKTDELLNFLLQSAAPIKQPKAIKYEEGSAAALAQTALTSALTFATARNQPALHSPLPAASSRARSEQDFAGRQPSRKKLTFTKPESPPFYVPPNSPSPGYMLNSSIPSLPPIKYSPGNTSHNDGATPPPREFDFDVARKQLSDRAAILCNRNYDVFTGVALDEASARGRPRRFGHTSDEYEWTGENGAFYARRLHQRQSHAYSPRTAKPPNDALIGRSPRSLRER